MSIDHYFYVETLTSGVWTRPSTFPGGKGLAALGEFAWLKRNATGARLFFGDGALFQFRRGRPPATESSALFAYIDRGLDWDELDPHWLPFEELFIDTWDEPALLVEANVLPALAALFEDGQREFPTAALLAHGVSEQALQRLLQGALVTQAIDRTVGRPRHELETVPTSVPLSVTWRDSVTNVLGLERAQRFRELRSYGEDSELRVVALLG